MDANSVTTSIQSALQTLESNPIIPLVASGGLTVWIITNLKNIYHVVKDFVVSLISFNIHNAYEDNRGLGYYTNNKQLIFNKIISQSKSLWERTKQLDLSNTPIDDRDITRGFNNTYGFSIRILFGKLVFCWRAQKADGQKMMITTSLQVFFARKEKFMKKLEDKIHDEELKLVERICQRDNVNVFYGSKEYGNASQKHKRKLDSIFTNNDEHIKLYEDILKFIDNKDIYMKLNYPYKYSCLLYGKPGVGKSSTILAIASELNRDVEYVNLATSSVIQLMDKLNANTRNKIFVFEDIDALNSSSLNERSEESSSGGDSQAPREVNQMCVVNNGDGVKVFTLSLSDLLNITDGLLSSDGAICIFTTNHIDKLDSALLRAGRMNRLVEFDYLNAATANRMLKAYLGHEVKNLKDGIKPPELQEDILNILLGRETEEVLKKHQFK